MDNISDLRFFGILLSLSFCLSLISQILSCIAFWRASFLRLRNSLLLLSLGFGGLEKEK